MDEGSPKCYDYIVSLNCEKLRSLREAKGWSLAEAAAKAGLSSKGHWSDLERGIKTDIRLSTLERLSKALGVSPAELIS